LSLHEIYWRLDAITNRENLSREFKASLHGLKLERPTKKEEKKQLPLSDDQEKAMGIALERAKKRKRLEFVRGN
jgi:hypothetical protein